MSAWGTFCSQAQANRAETFKKSLLSDTFRRMIVEFLVVQRNLSLDVHIAVGLGEMAPGHWARDDG